MNNQNKEDRQMSDQKLIDGIEKNYKKSEAIELKGDVVTIGELLAMLKKRIAAGAPVEEAKRSWIALAEEERAVVEESQPVIDAFRHHLVTSKDESKLADYGIVVRKRRQLTATALAARVLKAKATRERRRAAASASVQPAPAPAPATGGS
jgi:hypothetical protein